MTFIIRRYFKAVTVEQKMLLQFAGSFQVYSNDGASALQL